MSIGYILDEGDDRSRDARTKRLEAENADLKAKLEATESLLMAALEATREEVREARDLLVTAQQEQEDE